MRTAPHRLFVLVPGLALLLAASVVFPRSAAAQDVEGQEPGVIERNNQDDQDQGDAPQDADDVDEDDVDGEVIRPGDVDMNEEYNLPQNFDPDYRPERTPQDTRVTIDFRDADLEEVVKFFAGAMNRNFIISDSLQANKTITILSPQEVTLAQAYRAFVAALEMNGLTIVPFGAFYKIIESDAAISEPMDTYGADDTLPNEPRMVTAIVPVQNTSAEEMEEVIQNFTTDAANIITYGNSLIITENASNLQRIRNMVRQLDEEEVLEEVYVYDVQYGDATEIREQLNELFEPDESEEGGGGGNNRRRRGNENEQAQEAAQGGAVNVDISRILADERTNKLIFVADPNDFDKIRQMIELLDVPTDVGGQIHVKFLEYADAEELASTLSNLTSGQNQDANQRARRGRRQQQAQEAVGGDVAALLEGDVQITAYTPNNALVVTASPKDYVSLESVVELLDRPRRQVYVEAVIMEIGMDVNRDLNLGFNTIAGQDFDGIIPDSAEANGLIDDTEGGIVGSSNFDIQNLADAFGGDAAGALGLIGPLATLPGTEISLPAFALTLQATQQDESVNLLSAPAVMTLDNEEAEIVVGDRVPFAQGFGGGGLGGLAGLAGIGGLLGGGSNLSGQTQTNQRGTQTGLGGLGGGLGALGGLGTNPIQYEDVGITLRILPQINESNYVRLEIEQEVSDVQGGSATGSGVQLTPTTTQRSANTVVLVEDQSSVVIGGLMRERESDTVQKVPFLGDIPVLGTLFRSTSTRSEKQNLVLVLTPYIIESKADMQKIYERKMAERRELAQLFKIQEKEYDAITNYEKKSGIIERMRGTLQEASRKEEARRRAREAFENQGSNYHILGQERDDEEQPQQQEGQPESNGQGDLPEPPTRGLDLQQRQQPDAQQPAPGGAQQPQGAPGAEPDAPVGGQDGADDGEQDDEDE